MNSRLQVVVPGLLIGVAWSIVCLTPVPFGLMYGPFAMLIGMSPGGPGYNIGEMWVEAAVLFALIAVHPFKPNVVTGVISGVGLFLWFFLGLVYMSDGA